MRCNAFQIHWRKRGEYFVSKYFFGRLANTAFQNKRGHIWSAPYCKKNFTCDKFEINFSFNRANKMGNFLRDIHLPHTGSILWSTPPLASGLHPLLLHYINRCSIFTTIFSHVNRNFYLTGSIFIILHGVSKD